MRLVEQINVVIVSPGIVLVYVPGISASVVVVVVGAVSVVSFISAEHNSDGTAQRDGTTNADVVAAAARTLRTTAENCIVIYIIG